MVFDSELQQQRTIPAGDMDDVYDVTEMSNGDVIIAAHIGLYHDSNGECCALKLMLGQCYIMNHENTYMYVNIKMTLYIVKNQHI